MAVFENLPLIIALFAILFAQGIKVPIHYIVMKEFKPGLAFSTGGMPSSHSAAVAAVTTSVGIEYGVTSGIFAVSCVFSLITMFDATGIRRQAGEQAIVLNMLVKDFQYLFEEAREWSKKKEFEKKQELKELLGHQPIEVFFGGLTGIALAFIGYSIF